MPGKDGNQSCTVTFDVLVDTTNEPSHLLDFSTTAAV